MIWRITGQMIRHRSFAGVGYGYYGREYLHEQADFLSRPENAGYADRADNLKGAKNEYLQTWAELGLPGGILVLFVLLMFLCRIIAFWHFSNIDQESQSLCRLLGTSIIVILLQALIDNPFYVPSTMLLFSFNLAMISRMEKLTFVTAGTAKHLRIKWFQKEHQFFFPLPVKIILGILPAAVGLHVIYQAEGYINWKKGRIWLPAGIGRKESWAMKML